jgi:hypothetical protein
VANKILAGTPPAVLHTNRESRFEALKYYALDFGSFLGKQKGGFRFSTPPEIYINREVDIVCLKNQWFQEAVLEGLKQRFHDNKLQLLAMNISAIPKLSDLSIVPAGLKQLLLYHLDHLEAAEFFGKEAWVLKTLRTRYRPKRHAYDTIPAGVENPKVKDEIYRISNELSKRRAPIIGTAKL